MMRLSFLPGELFLEQLPNGAYQVRQGSAIVGEFKSHRRALAAFNQIRQKLEEQFPPSQPTHEEKKQLMAEELIRPTLGPNSLRNAPAKKPTRTRTFG